MTIGLQSVDKNGNIYVYVSGQVDLYTSPNFRKYVLDAVEKSTEEVVIVLEEVEYMDSSGVATLVEGLRSARKKNRNFSLANPSPAVRKILNLARLESVFPILDSLEK